MSFRYQCAECGEEEIYKSVPLKDLDCPYCSHALVLRAAIDDSQEPTAFRPGMRGIKACAIDE